MPHLIRKTLRRLALAAGLALPAAASAGYSQIYVLGDSLSDVGNIEAAYAPIVAANGGVPLPILGLAAPGTPSAYAPSRASNGPIWIDTADEALCNDCGTCYQELPQFFTKTTVVIDGEARVIARMIPGAAESVEVTPEVAKRIDRVRANCDAEIIR